MSTVMTDINTDTTSISPTVALPPLQHKVPPISLAVQDVQKRIATVERSQFYLMLLVALVLALVIENSVLVAFLLGHVR